MRGAAAQQGDCDALYSIGGMYEEGRGCSADGKKAMKCYALAGEQGHANADLSLGIIQSEGRPDWGVPADRAAAIKTLSRAAKAGQPEAENMLAELMNPAVLAPGAAPPPAAAAAAAAKPKKRFGFGRRRD